MTHSKSQMPLGADYRPYAQESVWSHETGVKGALADERPRETGLRLNWYLQRRLEHEF